MKSRINPFVRSTFLAGTFILATGSALAATYQWTGVTSSAWATASNWPAASGITAGPPPVSGAHRINIKNGANFEAVYDSLLGTRTYGGSNIKGLVIGNPGNATMRITGGKFVTQGTTTTADLTAGVDVVGNTNGTASLIIDGGEYESGDLGLTLGLGGGPTSSLTINNGGLATISTLNHNATTATTNLNSGGTLAVNKITGGSGTKTFNINGGTLRARQDETTFISGLSALNINSGGAIIDTNTFNVTIANTLRDGGGGGGLTKDGDGTLTLNFAPTYTGPTVINGGTLALNLSTPLVYNNTISGAGSLAIGGPVTLGGASTYLGATSVNAGSLTLNGSLTSDITVASGAILNGEGSTSGSIDFTGTTNLLFNADTPAALTAASIDATGAAVTVAPSGSSGSGIVILQAAGGITGTIGSEFIGNSRLTLSYNFNQTQLLADYTPATLTWKGTDGINPTFWDTDITANWDNGGSPDTFLAGDNVLFDDTATTFTVAIQSAVLPGNVTFNHSNNDYIVNGSAIGGNANLIKNGNGVLTLNTPNTYTGTTTINGGTVILGQNSALGSADGGTTVATGATLDINNRNLGAEVITLSGSGDGSGALVNTGADQINAIGRIVLAADASIGGSNRWDLRNSLPTLDMGGFTLTKVDPNFVALVGVTVSNPGNIDVTDGNFSIQTSTLMGGSDANTITVRSGAVLSSWQAANPINWNLDLKNSATLLAQSAAVATNNHWAGPIALEAAGSVTVQGDATMSISGAISGTGSAINKTGTGVAFISGTNTYTGTTTVSAGSLVLRNTSALGGTDAGTSVASEARVELDNLTITGESISVSGAGGNFFGALQGRAGSSVWTGSVTVNADQTRIGAQAGATLEVSGVISSPTNHNLVFRPADATTTVILSGQNTYAGPTSILGGVVSVSSLNSVSGGSASSNLGAPTTAADGTIRMSPGATGTLRYTGTGETTDRVIDLVGTTFGAFIEQAGTGELKFTSDLAASGEGSKALVLSGSTAGTGELAGAIVDNSGTHKTSLRKDGSGLWTVSGPNTFTGNVLINGGVLRITNSSALGTAAKSITINATADKWLELDGSGGNITLPADFSFFTSGVNGAVRNSAGDNVIQGTFTMTVGNGNTRIISDNTGSLTLNGNIEANTSDRILDLAGDSTANNVFNGVLSNASSPGLAKSGTGTWILNGANLHTGATTINGGTLVLGSTGSIDASTALSIAAGAELDTTAKSSHTLPATVTFGIDGDSDTSGLIDATGQELAIGSANVTFNVSGSPSAPAYVLANYADLTGGTFASATPPAGYQLDYTHNGGTQIALVQTAGSGYDAWIDTYFPGETDPAIIGKDADPDGDGASNLLEFALNGIPNNGSNNGLYASLVQDASAPAGNELTLIAAVRDGATFANSGSPIVQSATQDGVVYTIEGSLDLLTLPGSNVSQASGPANTAPAATGLPDLTGTDWEYHTFKLDASEGLSGKGFLRIKVEAAP
jgi:autotransporter-associated beta strand protein